MKNVYVLLLVALVFCALAQEIDTVKPPEIDIFSKDATEFLNIDNKGYLKKGWEAYNTDNYEEAAKWYIEALKVDPSNSNTIYNLACLYGLLDKPQLAAEFLMLAYETGFDDIWHIQNDSDFENVKDHKAFEEVIDSLKSIADRKESLKGEVLRFKDYTVHNCYIKYPEDYDTTRSYPLLLALHGWGASGESFIGLWEKMEDEKKFIMACPQAPYPFDIGDGIGYSWVAWDDDSLRNAEYRRMGETYVMNVLRQLKEEIFIEDVYLLGFSQGAGLAFSLGLKFPTEFEAIVPWGGWMDEDWIGQSNIDNAQKQKILIVHGRDDKRVEYDGAKKALKLLQESGYKSVTLLDYEGGHSMPTEILNQAKIWIEEKID